MNTSVETNAQKKNELGNLKSNDNSQNNHSEEMTVDHRNHAYQSPFFDYQKFETDSNVHKLLTTLDDMNSLVDEIKTLNDSIRQIGQNSAIEASRSDKLLGEFESLTEDIGSMVDRAEMANNELKQRTHNLQFATMETIGVLLSERSRDIIDKIDRNLFERNCDCQAWATFPDNIRCLTQESAENTKRSCDLLEHLCNIYEVYHDIVVLNREGKIVSSGKNRHLIGSDQSQENWFRETLKGQVHVTDMFYCPLMKAHSVSYNCPVKDSNGHIIGVLSTRFNWDFVNQMIDTARVDNDNNVVVISVNGTVLSSKNRLDILTESLNWLSAAQISMKGIDGFSSETNRNGQHCIFGSARTKGYNNYTGKNWSVVTAQPVFVKDVLRFTKTFEQLNKQTTLASNEHQYKLNLIQKHEEQKKLTEETEQQLLPDLNTNLQSFDQRNDLEATSNSYIHSDVANLNLKDSAINVKEAISSINQINFDILLMSLNAAVKSERAGQEGKAFSVLSRQIRVISAKSAQATEKLNESLNVLMSCVQEIQQEKIKDASWDCIDKVDRNLFERNCDVQAWTVFDEVVRAAESGKGAEECNALLGNLHRIYEIYHDIYLLDSSGHVVASAVNRNVIGDSFADAKWFRDTMDGNVTVTDMYFSKECGSHTVAYSAPIRSSRGIVGVLTTRFNWDFIYDIVDKTIAPNGSEIYLLNRDGLVIASSDREGILKKSYADLPAFKLASDGEKGVMLYEDEKSGSRYFVGYAKTEGYNRYKGKGWICLAFQPADYVEEKHEDHEEDLEFN